MKRHHTSKLEDAVYHYEIIKITLKTLEEIAWLKLIKKTFVPSFVASLWYIKPAQPMPGILPKPTNFLSHKY